MRYFFVLFVFFTANAAAQSIRYANGNNSWNEDSLGNHRFVINLSNQEYAKNKKVAIVTIPWRRHDEHPEEKGIVITDAAGRNAVKNLKVINADNESGTILFQPVAGAGTYYMYYLQYRNIGSPNYPKGIYLRQNNNVDADWQKQTMLRNLFAKAVITKEEAINDFNSFYPMEIIATAAEIENLLKRSNREEFIVFPESRMYPVKMKTYLPQRWMQRGLTQIFTDTASRGEYLAFQLAVYALHNLKNIQIHFSDLKSETGKIIAAKNISCLNTDGTTYDAHPFKAIVDVSTQTIEPMWCAIDVPENTQPGIYSGNATIGANNCKPQTIRLNIMVNNKLVKNDDQPQKQTRLKWLNSTLAQENTIIDPYIPLKISGNSISFLGRNISINDNGFPAQIQTFFTPEMTGMSDSANNLITEPIHFHFTDAATKKDILWKNGGFKFLQKDIGTVSWEAVNTASALQMQVNASLEFDGFLFYKVKVIALEDVNFSNVSFHIPVVPQYAQYFMGLGLKGGARTDSLLWKWDVANKNQDGGWIGAVNGGMQFSLRDENYSRPLNTNFYLQKPLLLPASWGNDNKGGINVFQKGSAVLVNAYTGGRSMKKGDVFYYNFNLLITPFHTINTDFQWQTRFYHRYENVDSIKAKGATVVNIHHGTAINPYINYPFIEWQKMKSYIDSAHALGLKVKIYNTVRELSNRAYETFPMRSFGHEIYSSGKGGGFSWLQEHVGNDYIAAWYVPEVKDAAIVNSGMSRWHNYYVEGMNWLVKNVGIDGIYLDDVAFDRITMKRIKRVLTKNGHPGIIDLHSANQYNKSDGFNNSANLYMEHFPYLNRLWFGEYFDYEKNGPDFFLTEVSGIPFGLMGEMLQGGGNAWRGMIYGMTNRIPWSDNADPRPIWKLWDEFGMQSSEMIGYWSSNCPVKTNNEKVLVTVYKKQGKALLSIASWADTDVDVKLLIDWKKLGIDPFKATITATEVTNFQPAANFGINDNIPVKKGKGWLLVVK